ncbi:hypothetical protein ZIOFF_018534 [Zingiber officinale]|uniref:Protein kinase domain-containing protein n=1 Tax=Zingiber officinale TaxID=94328 RepID=A0A8J5LIU1_ZINOF|nr:hypothetical protein ZIOFF_018534 [Zingiber officinale]
MEWCEEGGRRSMVEGEVSRAVPSGGVAEEVIGDKRKERRGRDQIDINEVGVCSSVFAEARAMARAANVTVYTPELLAAQYSSRPLKAASRTAEIFTALGAFAFKLLVDQRQGQVDQRKRQRAAELRKTLTRLGPTFVKIGQGLSTRPDICPQEYLEELSELQDALPTFPNEKAFACIEAELGVSLDSMYSAISPEPIAAASLGQVYKAQLKQTGRIVAVKVQRPGIEEAIGLDFYLLRGLGFLVNKYVDLIPSDVVALIDEFAKREGKNARRFKKLYSDKEEVHVPDIYWDYTSAKVLTMDWVDGVKLSAQEAIEKRGLKMLNLVDIGIQCSLRQLLEYGYFHADPHPGNLLATPEGKLAFIDFGLMSETPEEARSAIIGHVVHMVNRDYDAMARDYYALNFLTPDVDVSPIVPALKNFFDDALNSTVGELNFKTIVDGLGNVLYEYPFNVPAYYALILRSFTVLEGLAIYADPNFKVIAASYPYFAKRLLTDPNPYLRDALIELLFQDGRFRQAIAIVTEAIVFSSMMDTYDSMPDFMKVVIVVLVFGRTAMGSFQIDFILYEAYLSIGLHVLSAKSNKYVTRVKVGKMVSQTPSLSYDEEDEEDVDGDYHLSLLRSKLQLCTRGASKLHGGASDTVHPRDNVNAIRLACRRLLALPLPLPLLFAWPNLTKSHVQGELRLSERFLQKRLHRSRAMTKSQID